MTIRKRKYNNGTGTAGVGYVVNPNQSLSEFQLLMDKAKAEGEGNVWANTVIPMATSLISSFAGSQQPQAETGEVAAMGKRSASGPIEVEGKEVLETPSGQMTEVKGPSHEAGGVDANVPAGTQIFSDRIKVQGKTMAERKKAREDKIANLDKVSATRTGDIATKNSATRMKAILEAEEESDLMVQELAGAFTKMKNSFATGTGPTGVPPILDSDGDGIPDYIDGSIGLNAFPTDNPLSTSLPNETPMSSASIDNMLATDFNNAPGYTTLQPEQLAETNGYSNPDAEQPSGIRRLLNRLLGPNQESTATAPDPNKPSTGYKPTPGDITGLFGNLVSTFGPLNNTLEARAGDTPNVNSFEDFGNDALATNERMMGLVKGQEANALTNVRRNAVATKRSARNSSRSVNTQRATDTMIDLESNNQELGVNDNATRQLMQVLGQRVGLENQQDQVVMTGEAGRDLADRQDRDNFYTNKARDIATMGQGIQETGKDLNAISENDMYMKMLNQMSKYFQFDSEGNIIGIQETKTK